MIPSIVQYYFFNHNRFQGIGFRVRISLLLRRQRSDFVHSYAVFAFVFTILLIIGSGTSVWAAQLDARINPDSDTLDFTINFQRTVFLEYPEGGELASILRAQEWKVEKTADKSDPGVQDLMKKLNDKLATDGSSARITDLTVDYSAKLTGRGLNTSIDYKITLNPTLSFFNIREYSPDSPALVDIGWRGLTVDGPVEIDGQEINFPISVIRSQEPKAYEILAGTEGETILLENIINADGIKNQPLSNWHFLFDPTGINVDAGTFGLSEEISGFVVSSYTMGESSIREGRQVEKVQEAEFTADRPYAVRAVESADSANVDIIGFAAVDELYGTEVFGVSPESPEGYAQTSTGEFPVMIIYGMAGMAGIGAVAILFISSRKLKAEEGMGQTGIDPSQLRGVATSASAGGYQTVRGEAQLIDGGDYEQTRSVYEEEKKDQAPSESSSSTKGSMPKGWKPS